MDSSCRGGGPFKGDAREPEREEELDSPGAEAALKLITRFPSDQLVKSLDPPSEYMMRLKIGSTAYREFIFDSDHEVIPGEWTFEFWYGSRKIGAQKFCVYEADPSRPSRRAGCSAAIALSLNSRP